jgi:hypothetical protein
MKMYELYNFSTGETLADNLAFQEVPELFEAYSNLFPNDEIIVCCRDTDMTVTYATILNPEDLDRKNFYSQWLELMDELVVMDNVY